MFGIRITIERAPTRTWQDLPDYGRRLLLIALLLSLSIHALSYLSAQKYSLWSSSESEQASHPKPMTFHLADAAKLKSDSDKLNKQILETPLQETAPPKESTRVGPQDHATDRETKLAHRTIQPKALDAGERGREVKTVKPKEVPATTFSGPGTLAFGNTTAKPRNNYERLLPNRESDVFGTPNGGFQDYIDDNIPASDHLDMNTTNFKFISYFTGLRKAIDLVLIYPSEAAQRGMQGQVLLEFIIEKDGRVSKARIKTSSGYVILDDTSLDAIKMAAPFAPLPKAWGKERILVTGSINYQLTNSGH